jgi:hypothetical protein
MANIISSLIIELVANTAKFVSGMEKANKSLESTKNALSIIKLDSIINLGERAFAAGERIYGMARNVASSLNEIERMSKLSGLSTDTFQKMAYAANMTDVNIESLSTGMKILAGHMDDVAKGNEQARILFESIGLSTIDTSGKMKSFDTILGDLADRFKSMPDGVQKVALAVDLFGRSGQELIPFLNQGRSGLTAFYEEARKMGIILDESVIRKGGEAEDTFKKLEAQVTSLKLSLAPAALAFAKFFADLVSQSRDAAGKFEAVVERIRGSSKRMLDAQDEWRKKRGYPGGATGEEIGVKKGLPSMFSSADVGLETLEQITPILRQSEEAIKAMNRALEEQAKIEVKLNAFYADDVELNKQLERSVINRNKAIETMAALGVKTQAGAKKEIEDIETTFKSLLGQGFAPEEIEAARKKLEDQLQAVREKYSTKTPEEGAGGRWEEIQVAAGKETAASGFGFRTKWETDWRWVEDSVKVHSTAARDELTQNVTDMVRTATDELERMQRTTEQITGPKTIMIDYSPVTSAAEAAEQLRAKLNEINGSVITVTIQQRIVPEPGQVAVLDQGLAGILAQNRSKVGLVLNGMLESSYY